LRSTTAALIFALVGLAVFGCDNVLGPASPAEPNRSSGGLLPTGARLDSARLVLHVSQANGQWVIIHPATAAWDEATVTWNSVGPWLSPFIVGSFTARDTGWISLDVSGLVAAWLDGIWQNYGIVLDQNPPNVLPTVVHSREAKVKRAKLRLYSSGGMVELVSIADASIRDVLPNANDGSDSVLLTGWAGEPTGENRSLLKFGTAPPEPVSSLGNRVWYDQNANGIQDDGEAGIADVVVDLYNCSDALVATTITDAVGAYFFDSLVAGDYMVAFSAPPEHVFSAPAQGVDAALDSDADPATGHTGCITLSDGVSDSSFDAGLYVPPSSLGDRVWHDQNANGIQEDGEAGLADVVVNLYDCGGSLLASTMTGVDGSYHFNSLASGQFVIEFVAPASYVFSAPAQSDDATDSDADQVTGQTSCVTLASGVEDGTWDAGLFVPGPELPGCTYGMGFWKNHAGFGPQEDLVSARLPIVLGTPGGAKSLHVNDAATAYAVLEMRTYGHASNGITRLYAQLLVAKLNIAAGASDDDITADLANADSFLAGQDWTAWSSIDKAARNLVEYCTESCGRFNKGALGPGHCGDDGE
jgi:hypothetical protein